MRSNNYGIAINNGDFQENLVKPSVAQVHNAKHVYYKYQ